MTSGLLLLNGCVCLGLGIPKSLFNIGNILEQFLGCVNVWL